MTTNNSPMQYIPFSGVILTIVDECTSSYKVQLFGSIDNDIDTISCSILGNFKEWTSCEFTNPNYTLTIQNNEVIETVIVKIVFNSLQLFINDKYFYNYKFDLGICRRILTPKDIQQNNLYITTMLSCDLSCDLSNNMTLFQVNPSMRKLCTSNSTSFQISYTSDMWLIGSQYYLIGSGKVQFNASNIQIDLFTKGSERVILNIDLTTLEGSSLLNHDMETIMIDLTEAKRRDNDGIYEIVPELLPPLIENKEIVIDILDEIEDINTFHIFTGPGNQSKSLYKEMLAEIYKKYTKNTINLKKDVSYKEMFSESPIKSDIDTILENTTPVYQRMLLQQAKVFGNSICRQDSASNVEKYYDNIKGKIIKTFQEEVSCRIIKDIQKSITNIIQNKCIIYLEEGDFIFYDSWSKLQRKFAIEEMSHPLLNAILSKFNKKYKGYSIILGPGTVKQKSKSMYRYMLDSVNAGTCHHFDKKKSLKAWYKKCVDKYGYN